ncbi:Protein red1 [Wickerhamiella sorbophila]|uniref:Protein red1 n=1 Tax=Wickerhamiella sorbophila TaxID=45607 RepID=A0A2T0FCW2_9ASCO|nr:Protein red1 [Wickerhamiella sorbophila]PRT52836.1 Protein red1 [Wickerhamiella sorbophila]
MLRTADELRAELLAKKRQREEEAQKREELAAQARGAVYDLVFLGLSFKEILQRTSIAPQTLALMFKELKLPYRMPTQIYESPKPVVASPRSTPPVEPPKPSDRFGADRWSKEMVIEVSDSEDEDEMEIDEVSSSTPSERSRSADSGELSTVDDVQSRIRELEEKIKIMRDKGSVEAKLQEVLSQRELIAQRRQKIESQVGEFKIDQLTSSIEANRVELNRLQNTIAAQTQTLKEAQNAAKQLSVQLSTLESRDRVLASKQIQLKAVKKEELESSDESDTELTIEMGTETGQVSVNTNTQPKVCDFAYSSPLHIFSSHRFSPFANVFAPKYNSRYVSSDRLYCKTEASGKTCRDDTCPDVHASDFNISKQETLRHLSEAVVGDPKEFRKGLAKQICELEKVSTEFDPLEVAKVIIDYRHGLDPVRFLDWNELNA